MRPVFIQARADDLGRAAAIAEAGKGEAGLDLRFVGVNDNNDQFLLFLAIGRQNALLGGGEDAVARAYVAGELTEGIVFLRQMDLSQV